MTSNANSSAKINSSQNLNIAPIFLPINIPADTSVTARNAIAHTPNADADAGPEPNICDNSSNALVMGKKTLFCARISESETSSMEKLKANNPPTSKFAPIRGKVIRHKVFTGPAPKLRAAFSNSSGVCSRPATTARTT